MKKLKNKAGSVLLILALVFTSLCSSVTSVHADTETVEIDNLTTGLKIYAIFTYTTSSTLTKTTLTLTRIQVRNNSGEAQNYAGMFPLKATFKDANGNETELASFNSTINNGATITLWSGSRSVTYDRDIHNTSKDIATVSSLMQSAFFRYSVPALPQFAITYEPNGGQGDAITKTTWYGYHKGSDATFQRPGYAFTKWTTNADGTGTPYTKDSTITVAADTTLYAQWVPGITYNGNGGLPFWREEALTGSNTISDGSISRTGADFLGWNTEKDGSGTSFTAGDSYTSMEPLALYAQWEVHFVPLHYDANGGENAPPDQDMLYDEETRLSDVIPTREGYLFKGWSTDPNAKIPSIVANGLYKKANVEPTTVADTLYAVWENAKVEIKHRDLFSVGKSSSEPPTAKATTKDESQEYGDLRNIKGEGWQYEVFDEKTPDGTENHENALISLDEYVTRSIPFAADSTGGFIWVDVNGASAYKKGEIATYLFADGLLIFNVLPKDFSRLALEHGAVLGEYEPNSFTRSNRNPQWAWEKEYIVSVDWNGYKPTSIPANAFSKCTSLASISLPSSVETIEDGQIYDQWFSGSNMGAFLGCTSLTSADLSSVKNVGAAAFQDCTALTSVTGLSAAENIGNYAFYGCPAIGDIGTLSSIKTIGDYAFYPNVKEETELPLTVQVPTTVTSVGKYAFSGGTYTIGTDYLNILYQKHPGVTITGSGNLAAVMGEHAFEGCTGITSITLDCESVPANAFFHSGLTSVALTNNVKTIGSAAFGSNPLASVSAPAVTSIEGSAFTNTQLTSFAFPATLTNLGASAFSNSASLASITYKGGTYTAKDAAKTALTNGGVTVGFGPFNGTAMTGNDEASCVTEGTKITMADGTQKNVEDIKPGDMLLALDHETGELTASPVVFNDADPEKEYEVMTACFNDGTKVEIVSEHGFFDLDLGEYVYISEDTTDDYIGHRFLKLENGERKEVTLEDVKTETKLTKTYSPVTYKTLNYMTEDMLSMPGGINGMFNIFEVNANTLAYDADKKASDIRKYGLLTLEDYNGMISGTAFEAFNGEYLGVAIGKGNISWEDIEALAEKYSPKYDN